jgi:uncharacterized phage protein gp47/JayE
MSLTFTPDGLTIQTYDEIYAELAAGYRTIYGPDINLDPDSPDGQRVGIEAKARLDLQAFALALYNQFDPDMSAGEMLNKIIKLAGITRRPASRSQVDVTITTDRDLTLPVAYAVEDDLGQQWITTGEVLLVTGANAVTLVAEEFGAVAANATTVTTPATIIIGVVSVTNAAAATVGRDEEFDADLRIRRNNSLESPATSTRGGMYAAVGNLTGITDLQVYENDTDVTDADGIPAHSLWIVVEGGTVAEIVETIVKNKTGGTGLLGVVSGTYEEPLIRPDGTTYVLVHTAEFDRPTEVPLYITLDVLAVNGEPIDQALIKSSIATLSLRIAEHVTAGGLYQYAYAAGDGFVATNMQVSRDNITYTDGRLDPLPDEKFTIDVLNITITDITPP